MHRFLFAASLAALSLGACSKGNDAAPAATDPALTEAVQSDAPAPPSTETAAASPTAEVSATGADQADKTIPAGMRGRWGVNAADCSSRMGETKGQMVIDAKSVRFYESIGEIATVSQRSNTLLKANWAFEGEGMQWKRDMTLTLQPGGKVLIKQEYGADAPQGPYSYKRCG